MTRLRSLLEALFPGAIIFGLAIASLFIEGGEARALELTDTYGLVVYGVGIALAWVFHRSRALVLLACLAMLELALVGAPDRGALLLAYGTLLVGLTGALALTRDRGMLSRGGTAQATVGAVVVLLATVLFDEPEALAAFAAPTSSPLGALWPGLPGATLVAAILGLGGVAFAFYRWRGPVDRSLVWTVLLLLLAMHPAVGPSRSAIMLVAAGLTMTLSVVETSYLLAYRDDLTGLLGRRALMQDLDGINGVYAIAMVDVDHFKKFNDKHGHDVGDQVLQMVASKLARTPGGPKAYRYGGEEFTLLFAGRTAEMSKPHLEAVRDAIENATFSLRSWRRPRKKPTDPKKARGGQSKKLFVTVSLGVADTTGDDDTPEIVLKRADQALYRAKKKGRNRVST